jgi:hypothetical protein
VPWRKSMSAHHLGSSAIGFSDSELGPYLGRYVRPFMDVVRQVRLAAEQGCLALEIPASESVGSTLGDDRSQF